MPFNVLLPLENTRADHTIVCCTITIARRRRQVMTLGIFADGSRCRKLWRKPRHALADAPQPLGWHAGFIALVELRNHFAFQQGIKSFCLLDIPSWVVAVFLAVPNGPAH